MLNVGTRARARERDERGIAHVWTSDFSEYPHTNAQRAQRRDHGFSLCQLSTFCIVTKPRKHDLRPQHDDTLYIDVAVQATVPFPCRGP